MMKAAILLFALATAVTARSAFPPPPQDNASIHGKGSFAPSPRGRIYYETEGAGPPVFVVAGGPGASHTSFHPWFGRLAPANTVVYFDNVGRGRSDDLPAPKGYTVAGDAEDIEALRSHLGFERISLVGHSYGGFPAMAYALKYPDRVERLVLSSALHNARVFQANIDTVNLHCRNQFPELWEKLKSMRKQGVKSSAEEYARIYRQAEADLYWYEPANAGKLYAPEKLERSFSRAVYLAMLGDDPEWVVGGTLKGYDPSDRMRDYTGPVLICSGRYDRISLPRIATEIAGLLPRSRLTVFEQSGHRPWIEETDRYFDVVSRFLDVSATK